MASSGAARGRAAAFLWAGGGVVVLLGLAAVGFLSSYHAGSSVTAAAGRGAVHLADPAAVYCADLGYEFRVEEASAGQGGVCAFPDGNECDVWSFLEGKCGDEHSYCARQGYLQITATDGRDPFSADYAVCTTTDGTVVGSVAALTGLAEKAASSACALQQGNQTPVPPAAPSALPGSSTFLESLTVPASFDWRSNGGNWLTPIRDQGQCGSCWAFAAAGAVEAGYNIAAADPGLDVDLSEQYLVSDCSDAGNCCGGWHAEALEFIRTAGVPDEACLPYVDGGTSGCACTALGTCDGICTYRFGGACSDRTCANRCSNWASRIRRIDAWGAVPATRASVKQYMVNEGPLAAAMYVSGANWDGDIARCADDGRPPDHGVVLVGYDDAGGYWVVRNSWGTGFGEAGYFKVGYGECRIEDFVYYARTEPPPAPVNDNFAAAETIGTLPVAYSLGTQAATTEPQEPQPPITVGATVWYRHTPSVATTVTIDSFGSTFDTILAVYQGGSLADLATVTWNDDTGGLQSRVEFAAAAGVTYWFQVGGYHGASGSLLLTITGEPSVLEGTFHSMAGFDGWVLERDAVSGKGGTFDSVAGFGRVGDDASNRQYRSILHFDTSTLPDNAVVTSVVLRVKRLSIVGGNPFTTHGLLSVDLKAGAFHDYSVLERFDFHAVGTRGNVGRFIKTPADGWYRAPLRAAAYPLVNLTGSTQLRLRFLSDDDNDSTADYLAFYSGNAGDPAVRPQLVVTYDLP